MTNDEAASLLNTFLLHATLEEADMLGLRERHIKDLHIWVLNELPKLIALVDVAAKVEPSVEFYEPAQELRAALNALGVKASWE